MQSVAQYKFYELGVKLHAVLGCPTTMRVADFFTPLMEAQAALDALVKGEPVVITQSRTDANKLLAKLSAIFNRYFIDPATKQFRFPQGDERVDAHELSLVRSLMQKFETSLSAELSRTPSYAVAKHGIFATEELVENADAALPEMVRELLPAEVMTDFRAAGRAIAFGLGAAAVMHLLRAIERVMLSYYESFGGAPMGPKIERNWNNTIKRLNALCDESLDTDDDRRIVQVLTQIRERYRNPMITTGAPDVTPEEALGLFTLGTSVITMMGEQMTARAERQAETPAENQTARHTTRPLTSPAVAPPVATAPQAPAYAAPTRAGDDPGSGADEEDDYREIYEFRLPQSA